MSDRVLGDFSVEVRQHALAFLGEQGVAASPTVSSTRPERRRDWRKERSDGSEDKEGSEGSEDKEIKEGSEGSEDSEGSEGSEDSEHSEHSEHSEDSEDSEGGEYSLGLTFAGPADEPLTWNPR